MTTARFHCFCLVGTALLLSACNIIEVRTEAEATVADQFEARRMDDLDKVAAAYGEAMFAETSRTEWERMLEKVSAKLGRPREFELTSWDVFYGDRGAGLGTYTTLQYTMTYEHATGQEQLVVLTRAGATPEIVGHHFESSAFLED